MVNQMQQHQRHCLLFLYDKDKKISAREAARELKSVYGAEAMSKTKCDVWLRRFRTGEKGVDDLEDGRRSGRPSTFDEDRLRRCVEEDPRLTIRQLAQLLNSSIGSIHHHLHNIGMVSEMKCFWLLRSRVHRTTRAMEGGH